MHNPPYAVHRPHIYDRCLSPFCGYSSIPLAIETHMYFSVTKIGTVGSSCARSESPFQFEMCEIFSWIEFRIDVFQAVVCGTDFSTIPAGLPGPGALSLGYSFALFIFAEEAQYNLARNVRLKNSETGVLGTRKIGTGEYCCVTRVQF